MNCGLWPQPLPCTEALACRHARPPAARRLLALQEAVAFPVLRQTTSGEIAFRAVLPGRGLGPCQGSGESPFGCRSEEARPAAYVPAWLSLPGPAGPPHPPTGPQVSGRPPAGMGSCRTPPGDSERPPWLSRRCDNKATQQALRTMGPYLPTSEARSQRSRWAGLPASAGLGRGAVPASSSSRRPQVSLWPSQSHVCPHGHRASALGLCQGFPFLPGRQP